MKFCEKLKMLREERNMSQVEFANLLGTSKQVISRYEKGENTPKITTVAHYADVLGVSLEFFMNDNVEKLPEQEKELSPNEPELTEGEEALLELFRKVPDGQQELVLQMIRAALNASK